MSEPYLSEIKIFGFNFPPRGWAQCDGQILPINQNQALFSLLGTTYGGDGRTTFALPELRGRTAVHEGQGAGFGDVVSAVTYVKHAEDAPRLREKFQEAGYAGFPNTFVHAPVCRPELLCETEALAVLAVKPKAAETR